ncbi:MAG: type IV pilus twitching motility protein PilT [Campylobacter sp.]|uniref:type IV pilus twitching motility protein PilT n=1 Tax=Campylobacter sp. TaxID=205 RepID=UPI002A90B1A3|nr:type IV pilus twitching motility protein PilT [Campylobacter sp.]MDY6187971.1 type IV pilus twitching motility protein PilT [Campylobacter sp.]
MDFSTINIDDLLYNVSQNRASDLHLVVGSEPQIRIDGIMRQLDGNKLNGNDIEKLCYSIITDAQKSYLEENKELDFAINRKGVGRFRANYYYTMNINSQSSDLAAAFRVIPEEIPSLDDLNAPEIFKDLVHREKGLVLVTGPTGSGKSTTLAAMLNEINITERKHIITIEEPVEFYHTHKRSLFSHRNVGNDTKSFANALRSALREDPDVILIGEMRDKETISIALTAAETGHLVFGTLHTNSAVQTVNRIVEAYPESEQAQMRVMLSSSLNAVISQALLPKIGGGRTAIHEILISNHAIANLIRENKIHQIHSQMQLNQQNTKMQTQTQAMMNAIRSGLISKESALKYSVNLQELKAQLGMGV